MKYLISACFIILLFAGCANNFYVITGGRADVPTKNQYNVTYQTELEEGLVARISYMDHDGKQHKEKKVRVLVDGKTVSEYEALSKHTKYSMRFDLP